MILYKRSIMIQKFLVLTFSISFMLISSCYTITHPDPCPGLVDLDKYDDVECVVVFND